MNEKASTESGLKRELGLLEATTIIMGSMIGSGIFLAPALIAAIIVADDLGPGTFVSIWAIGGVLTLCGALSYGELAAAFPHAGGQYVFPLDIDERLDDRERRILARMERLRTMHEQSMERSDG